MLTFAGGGEWNDELYLNNVAHEYCMEGAESGSAAFMTGIRISSVLVVELNSKVVTLVLDRFSAENRRGSIIISGEIFDGSGIG